MSTTVVTGFQEIAGNFELREDGSYELREDFLYELRQ